jgi:hypothetical protein
MKKLLLAAALVLLPATAFAQTPFAALFQKAADRLGMQPEAQQQVLRFAEGLQDDMVVDYTIHSVYPPVMDIIFASGKEIHAGGDRLQLKSSDYDFDDDYSIFENYAGLCILVFILGYVLLWVGFFSMSLQLAITGIELFVFALMLCL